MLIINLITQEWKKNFRAKGYYNNLAVNLLLGFFGLYMAVILLFVGFSLDEFLENADNSLNPMELFNGGLLYILLFGLVLRFMVQQLNTIDLPSYQILPIKRSSLINFLLLKPLINPLNYFLLLIVVPFTIQSVVRYYDVSVGLRFVLSFIFLVWFNSLSAAFLKRRFGSGWFSIILIIGVIAGVFALEYFNLFSLFYLSKDIFNFIILQPMGLCFPLIAVVIVFLINKWFFSKNYYPEGFNKKMKSERIYSANFSFLDRFGIVGEIISMEIKLILRHKRTKSMMYVSTVFLFYGLLFYTKDIYANNIGLLFFIAMFMTGLLMYMYGQWMLSWDSGHFDSLMTKNIPIKTYLKANYYLLLTFNILCFVLTTPYFYFGSKIIFMHIVAFIFNVGVNIYLLLFLATYNTKRIDLTQTSALNYQGTTFKNFLIVIPLMIFPMGLVYLISYFVSMTLAMWTLTIIGLSGIVLRKPLLKICVLQFNNRKYKMAEGFREVGS
jgi:hypothetical protein